MAEAVGTAEVTGAEAEGPDADAPGSAAERPEAAGARPAEGAEIPRQQSADEAADSEAGEDART
ncbi:gliding motility protein [Streptomyces collinus]